MKNGSHAATALHGRATLHLVIPSEAEGPAVQRTFRGNVFRQSVPGFPATRSSPTSTCAAFHLRKPHEARQHHQVRQEIRGSAVRFRLQPLRKIRGKPTIVFALPTSKAIEAIILGSRTLRRV